MLLNTFLHETHSMGIAHLFFDTSILSFLDRSFKKHPSFRSYSLCDAQYKGIAPSEVLLIEITHVNKDKLKSLVNIIIKNKPLVIYIFCDDVENTLLLKFSLHFNITDVLPLKDDPALLESLFTKNPNKLDTLLETSKKMALQQKFEHALIYLLFKEERLVYANAQAKAFFQENSLEMIEAYLYEDNSIVNLLNSMNDGQTTLVVETEENFKAEYLCTVKNFTHGGEKILFIVPYAKEFNQEDASAILNRFDFLTLLKEKHKQALDNPLLSLICFSISNLEKLQNALDALTLNESLLLFARKIIQLKESTQKLIQYSSDFYILINEESLFEDTCKQTRYLHQELIEYASKNTFTPVLISSALDIHTLSPNETLSYVDKIAKHTIRLSEIQKIAYYELSYLDAIADEHEQIHYLMQHTANNKIPIKLLNIYKGLCINTQSHIIRYTDDTYYLHCENLQGYAMQIEGETVLQAPNFPKDLKAQVGLVDIKKSFVILKNLSFMPYSANSRQHTRVQTTVRTPVLVKYGAKLSFQGEVIDISINSIALRCNIKTIKSNLVNETVRLTFSLPYEQAENGYVVLDIEGKVTFMNDFEEFTKIVVMLKELNKPYDEYLLQYMYERQKELILEIRRATKAYN